MCRHACEHVYRLLEVEGRPMISINIYEISSVCINICKISSVCINIYEISSVCINIYEISSVCINIYEISSVCIETTKVNVSMKESAAEPGKFDSFSLCCST